MLILVAIVQSSHMGKSFTVAELKCLITLLEKLVINRFGSIRQL